jgi:hypothetical protein
MMYNKLMDTLIPATEKQKRYIIILLKQHGLDTESITPAHRALGAPAQATSVNDWLDGLSIKEADQLIRRLKAMPRQQPPLSPSSAHAAGARSGAALCLSRRYSPHPSLTPPIRGALLFPFRPCAACLAGTVAVAIFTGARCIGSVSALLLARTVMAALLWRVAVFAQPG